MIIPENILQASENRMPTEVKTAGRGKHGPRSDDASISFSFVEAAPGGDTAALPSPSPVSPQVKDAELVNRLANLSFGGAKPSTTELERLIGNNDLVDEFYLERALVAARPVMRIVLRDDAGGERGWATGFMVSPRLLLTNQHVFPTFEETKNAVAEANYVLDIAGNPAASYRFAVRGDQFFYTFQDLDFALVAVEPVSQDGKVSLSAFGFHRLNSQPNKIQEQECMTLIQHPGGERRQLSIRENQLVKITDGYLWYQSDTAPGSSGAPAFNDSFQVVALHHSGVAKRDEGTGQYVLKDGTKVDSLKGIDDSQVIWVANEGVRISTLCNHLADHLNADDPFARELFTAMQGGDILSNAIKGSVDVFSFNGNERSNSDPVLPQTNPVAQMPAGGSLTIPLLLNISVSLDNTVAAQFSQVKLPVTAAQPLKRDGQEEEDALEALSRIKVDRDYTNRAGYDAMFLSVTAPPPMVIDQSLVSKMADGSCMLPYEHFSVVVNKTRRLPLFTASNLDYSEKERHPEPGKYGRKDLTGTNSEVWLTDPRIPQQDQLPDRFYNTDGGHFDKGHVVRREDVCWGDSYAQVVRGNCDTFHVTNCTPQVAGFNRSTEGVDDWGDLEDEIQKQAKSERLCVFAGPILTDKDRFFAGKDDFGPIKIQIPKEFWKVVLANENGQLSSYAFVLQQDLTTVPEEFAVNATWKPYQVTVDALEARMVGFCFPPEIHAADQMKAAGGKRIVPKKKRAPRQAP